MFLAGVGLILSCLAQDDDPWGPNHGRGLMNFYDGHLFANKHLNLPLHTPHFLDEGGWETSLYLEWANTWARRATQQTYFTDGEALYFHPRFRYGLDDGLELGGELAIFHRSGGIMDSLVDGFHAALSLPDASRNRFPKNAYNATVTADGRAATLDDGFGVGDLSLWTKVELWEPEEAWAAGAFAFTVKAPTGEADFGSDGVDLGATFSVSKSFHECVHAYLGLAYVYYTDDEENNLLYHRSNWETYAGIEVDLHETLSTVLQATFMSPLLRRPSDFDDTRYSVAFGFLWSPWEDGRTFELGIVENLVNYKTTADFAFHFGYRHTF